MDHYRSTSVPATPVFTPVPTSDPVKSPDHYTWIPDIECKDVAKHFNWALGNVIGYVWQAGRKGDAIEDLRKAIECLEIEIERREAEQG